ncbi:hypothetical protein AgCh_027761 [Apium graveolens]
MKSISIISLFLTLIFSILVVTVIAVDTITVNQTIRGHRTIESAGGVFTLGLFGSGSSHKRYLGIWYTKIVKRTVVWVANRETALLDTSGVLRLDANGSLVLSDGTNKVAWGTGPFICTINPVAQLLDNGNLVVRYENDSNPENFLWQSFDYPTDNILPGSKIGRDMEKGLNRYLTSWRSSDDPSPGKYKFRVNTDGYPQLLVWKSSSVKVRFGPWDGIQFSGVVLNIPELSFAANFVFNPKEIYASFKVDNNSTLMRMMLTPNGAIQVLRWMDHTHSWKLYMTEPLDACGNYALCGAYGSCNITQSRLGLGACGCLKGFKPKFTERWKLGDWADGCVRKTQLNCGNGDGFVKYTGVKFPDARHSWFNRSMTLKECENVCLKNCSCTAYSNIDIRQGGIGCLLWVDELVDIRDYGAKGLDLYVRVAAADLEESKSPWQKVIAIPIVVILPVFVGVVICLFIRRSLKKRKLRRKAILRIIPESDAKYGKEEDDMELPTLDLIKIVDATNSFSQNNKIGEGSFGLVYKGILDDGQEIAVKRLSKDSRQGLGEFKNEVSYIAKLQHRNLVRLLGCCIEEGEMLLIYEYMPNNSLGSLLFDRMLSKSLQWPQRYNIINGIARGLLYLHQDSRIRVIHRDLKAGNILLDNEMNPKISDFGMARSFVGSERIANTTKVVGTFGYMSPEYALDGMISVKSDVYSFGVLLLETVSGRKMKGFYDADPNNNLLGHAWRLYKENKFLELVPEVIIESCNPSEVLRAIQIGLLCVQPHPDDRPSISLVVLMLSSEILLPEPKQPGFFTERTPISESDFSSNNLYELALSNRYSTAELGPR